MAELSCGSKALKYCLFAFNLVFVIAGIVCLGVGIWLMVDEFAIDKMRDTMTKEEREQATTFTTTANAVRNLGIFLASAGGIILVIAFLGCCGAVKEWRPLLAFYAIILLIILAVEISAAIYVAVKKDQIETDIQVFMRDTLKFYGGNDTNPNAMRYVWDKIMNESQCCGVLAGAEYLVSSRGFNDSKWRTEIEKDGGCKLTDPTFPFTCCPNGKRDSLESVCDLKHYKICRKENISERGCYESTKSKLQSKMSIIIGVSVAVGLIQLVGILFSLCLCRAITTE